MQENYKFSAQKYDILHISCGGATVKTFCFALLGIPEGASPTSPHAMAQDKPGVVPYGVVCRTRSGRLAAKVACGNLKSNF